MLEDQCIRKIRKAVKKGNICVKSKRQRKEKSNGESNAKIFKRNIIKSDQFFRFYYFFKTESPDGIVIQVG